MEYKYCDDEVFKKDTYQALKSQFPDYQSFGAFYSSLCNPKIKDEFLRVGTTYLFFAKSGDWHVNVQRSDPVVEYFTNSFKLVAIIAIIESLSDKKNVDFYQWLLEKDEKTMFPITDRSKLQTLYDEYKLDYGAIRRCKSFFSNLPEPTKNKLLNHVYINDQPVKTIEKFVELIYKARSNFAHECESTMEIGNWFHFDKLNNKKVVWKQLSMEYFQSVFEEGIVIHFRNQI